MPGHASHSSLRNAIERYARHNDTLDTPAMKSLRTRRLLLQSARAELHRLRDASTGLVAILKTILDELEARS
jgi:hypothetical protein